MTPAPSRGDQLDRDLFLDTVRAVAIVRVVTWHTYGWAPITWVVAAVPAMFFVSGHLLARSFQRRSPGAVVLDRLRRLLVPFWFFGLAAWLVMAVAHRLERTPETSLPWRSVVWWVLPLNDPRGSVWEGGWLSQPLWYVRCLVWLLLLSPLLWRAARRAPAVTTAALVAATLALELVYRRTTWHEQAWPDLLWRSGDITLYAVFLVLGFWHAGTEGFARGKATIVAVLAVPTAIGVALLARPQDWVVNNSHMLHLVVGGGWLAFALALRSPITRLASLPAPAAFVRGIGRRSLSIYLWHTAAVITTWQVLHRYASLPRGVHSVALGAGTVVGTSALVLLAGPVEDLAARRRSKAARSARPLAVRLAAPALGLALFAYAGGVMLPVTAATNRPLLAAPAGPTGEEAIGKVVESPGANASMMVPSAASRAKASSSSASASPRIPSRAPKVSIAAKPPSLPPGFSIAPPTTNPSANDSGATSASGPSVFQRIVDQWQDAHASGGLQVGIARPGVFEWTGGPSGESSGSFDIESITKTVTASAVWLLAADGVIDIDGPVPSLEGLPELDDRGFTVRQLLEHRTGLADYHNLATPEDDGEKPAVAVVRGALAAPPEFAPGAGQDYSSTNYLVLGLLIEARTGQSLDEVLWGRVLDPAGVGGLFHRAAPSMYLPGAGAGGLVTDMHGLLAWGDAFLREHRPVGDAIWAKMTQFDPGTALGAGVIGLCPCTGGFLWSGHTGGTTALFYDRRDNVLVASRIANGIWGGFEDAFAELVENLRVAAIAS